MEWRGERDGRREGRREGEMEKRREGGKLQAAQKKEDRRRAMDEREIQSKYVEGIGREDK